MKAAYNAPLHPDALKGRVSASVEAVEKLFCWKAPTRFDSRLSAAFISIMFDQGIE